MIWFAKLNQLCRLTDFSRMLEEWKYDKSFHKSYFKTFEKPIKLHVMAHLFFYISISDVYNIKIIQQLDSRRNKSWVELQLINISDNLAAIRWKFLPAWTESEDQESFLCNIVQVKCRVREARLQPLVGLHSHRHVRTRPARPPLGLSQHSQAGHVLLLWWTVPDDLITRRHAETSPAWLVLK